MSRDDYGERARVAASAALAKGHGDPANLRELLISTTSTATQPMVSEYFRKHLDDKRLLADLVTIALEGEDAGDAPWAAANVIAEFPASLLAEHEAALRSLAEEQWEYLSRPAKIALAKLQDR